MRRSGPLFSNRNPEEDRFEDIYSSTITAFRARSSELLFKDKIDGQDQKDEGQQMVPPERFGFEKDQSENCKNRQGNHLLNDF